MISNQGIVRLRRCPKFRVVNILKNGFDCCYMGSRASYVIGLVCRTLQYCDLVSLTLKVIIERKKQGDNSLPGRLLS